MTDFSPRRRCSQPYHQHSTAALLLFSTLYATYERLWTWPRAKRRRRKKELVHIFSPPRSERICERTCSKRSKTPPLSSFLQRCCSCCIPSRSRKKARDNDVEGKRRKKELWLLKGPSTAGREEKRNYVKRQKESYAGGKEGRGKRYTGIDLEARAKR